MIKLHLINYPNETIHFAHVSFLNRVLLIKYLTFKVFILMIVYGKKEKGSSLNWNNGI